MVPWTKLSKDAQKAILALVVIYGGATVSGCCPVVCDPAPPPSVTPTPSLTPMICDPPPPPAMTPMRFETPMICDPAPPPSMTPPAFKTPMICDPPPPPAITLVPIEPTAAAPRFQLRHLDMSSNTLIEVAMVRGLVIDAQEQPVVQVKVSLQTLGTTIETWTDNDGTFLFDVPNPGDYKLVVGDDTHSALPLQLKLHDVAYVEWVQLAPQSQAPLPLAEIRSVDIVWGDDLTFEVETPWADARYRWSVTGGTLIEEEGQVTWQPPSAPGRYLLQVVADWGYAGLAVDSLVLVVDADGSLFIS
jgi:hypothetical protein